MKRETAMRGLGLAVCATLVFLFVTIVDAAEPKVAAVWFYRGGQRRALPVADEKVLALVRVCEEQFSGADNNVRQIIVPEDLSETRNHEVALEIKYATPATFRLAGTGAVKQIKRLLVPLSGRFGTGPETFFFYAGASGPPYYKLGGRDAIVARLREVNPSIRVEDSPTPVPK
jgi:hypothetical protein